MSADRDDRGPRGRRQREKRTAADAALEREGIELIHDMIRQARTEAPEGGDAFWGALFKIAHSALGKKGPPR